MEGGSHGKTTHTRQVCTSPSQWFCLFSLVFRLGAVQSSVLIYGCERCAVTAAARQVGWGTLWSICTRSLSRHSLRTRVLFASLD